VEWVGGSVAAVGGVQGFWLWGAVWGWRNTVACLRWCWRFVLTFTFLSFVFLKSGVFGGVVLRGSRKELGSA